MRIKISETSIVEFSQVTMLTDTPTATYAIAGLHDEDTLVWEFTEDKFTKEEAKTEAEYHMNQLMKEGWTDLSDYVFRYVKIK